MGMLRRADLRLLLVVMVFLALLVVWAWPEGARVESMWSTDQLSK